MWGWSVGYRRGLKTEKSRWRRNRRGKRRGKRMLRFTSLLVKQLCFILTQEVRPRKFLNCFFLLLVPEIELMYTKHWWWKEK